jgi:hypothetical protein
VSLVANPLASSGRAIAGGAGGSEVVTGTGRGDVLVDGAVVDGAVVDGVVVDGVVGAVFSGGGVDVHPASTTARTTQIAIFADKPITPGSPTPCQPTVLDFSSAT